MTGSSTVTRTCLWKTFVAARNGSTTASKTISFFMMNIILEIITIGLVKYNHIPELFPHIKKFTLNITLFLCTSSEITIFRFIVFLKS